MRSLLIAMLSLFAIVIAKPASAHTHHHHYRHHASHHHRHVAHRDYHGIYKCAGCVVRDTLAGVVAVSSQNAERFVGLINDLVHAGFSGPVHCAAPPGTHVSRSKHYTGNACDFAQTGWGKTVKLMYTKTAAAIIEKWGFTNGCSFKDCGHAGTDGQGYAIASRHHRVRYAHRHHRVRYAAS